MEVQLQELLDQIKKDGVDAAQAEAAEILSSAKAEAEKIISDAKAQAESFLQNAKKENERFVKSGEDAIRQAGRNLLISFRDSVSRELQAIVSENVNAVYSSDAFAGLLVNVVSAWASKPDAEDLSLILNSNDLKALEDTVLSALKNKLSSEITLKSNDNFDGGFRIAVNGGSAYYDYSAEAVVQMLSAYLSPKVTALLKEAE
ncbi:MAG: V-type ATP synthase subunit E [Ruminococcaceae bacterium]|nr:V-type ATP synthase subunit E [Oscillospiraceae bacterium]